MWDSFSVYVVIHFFVSVKHHKHHRQTRPALAPAASSDGGQRRTHVVLVSGVTGQVPQEAGERAQLHVVLGPQQVQDHGQHPLLLQGHAAQHRGPLCRGHSSE